MSGIDETGIVRTVSPLMLRLMRYMHANGRDFRVARVNLAAQLPQLNLFGGGQ